MKHTPGPWSVDYKRNVWARVNGEIELIAQCCDMPCVDGSDDEAAQRGSEMETANALLIAAAPELLEMCKQALNPSRHPNFWADLRAAIAKAEGKG